MNISRLFCIAMLFLVQACWQENKESTSAKAQHTYQLVMQKDLAAYWVLEQTQHSVSIDKSAKPQSAGWVEVGFVIDDKGRPTNIEILRSVPASTWHSQARRAANQLVFKPLKTSVPKPQIYTTWTFYFSP